MKAATRGTIRPFEVMEAYREAEALARSGREVLHLSLGQPGKAAPERVRACLRELLGSFSFSGERSVIERAAEQLQHWTSTLAVNR